MRSPVRVTRKARDSNGRAYLLHVSWACRYGRCRLGLLLRGLPRPRSPAQPYGLGYALRKLRGSGSMARALPCALLAPSAPPCSLLLPKVASCPLVLENGGMIPLTGLAPTSFKTRAHSAPKSGVRPGLGSAPATLRLCLLFARGKAQPPAGFFIGWRLPFPHLCALPAPWGRCLRYRSSTIVRGVKSTNMFMRSYLQPLGAGGTLPALGRVPRPALGRSGGPRPSSLRPAPSGRAPRHSSGQGRAVARPRGGAFLSAGAQFCVYQNNSSKLEPFFSSATVFQFCPIILIFE